MSRTLKEVKTLMGRRPLISSLHGQLLDIKLFPFLTISCMQPETFAVVSVNTTSEGFQKIKHFELFPFISFSLYQDDTALSQTHTCIFALYNGETALHTGP